MARPAPLLLLAAAAVLLACMPAATAAQCDHCALDNGFTLSHALPFDKDKGYPACQQYRDNACCSYDTVLTLSKGDGLYGPEYSRGRCEAVGRRFSNKCNKWFIAEECAYECDPNFGKYRVHDHCDTDAAWMMRDAPLAASLCDAWYADCADDTWPSCGGPDGPPCDPDAGGPEVGLREGSIFSASSLAANESTCSRTVGDIFGGYPNPAEAFCNLVLEGAFVYEAKEEDAYVFDFPEGAPNPNDAVNAHVPIRSAECVEDERPSSDECPGASRDQHVSPSACQECHVRNVHGDAHGTSTKPASTPELEEDLGVCGRYANNSCCSPKVAAAIPHGTLYGEEYLWDRCDAVKNTTMSKKCAAWFRAESCLYECDANAGKYRKWEKCVDDAGYANEWQIEALPLRASECDSWYDACKDDYFCTCTEEDDCFADLPNPRSYFALPALDCTKDNCRTIGEIYANGSELCEVMWDNSFSYQTVEEDAYTMVWDPQETGGLNPNDFINPNVAFPKTCPGVDKSLFDCDADLVAPKVALHVVDDIILGDVGKKEQKVIDDALEDAEDATDAAVAGR